MFAVWIGVHAILQLSLQWGGLAVAPSSPPVETMDACSGLRTGIRRRQRRVRAVSEYIVILLLAALPMTNSQLDRGALVAQAGCHGVGRITIAEHGGADAKWLVTVRCAVPRVPTAEILRMPYEAPRVAPTPSRGAWMEP